MFRRCVTFQNVGTEIPGFTAARLAAADRFYTDFFVPAINVSGYPACG